jgi:hypothetical protein
VPELTVDENLILGREITAGSFLNRAATRARPRAIVRELNFDLRPNYKVSQLSTGDVSPTSLFERIFRTSVPSHSLSVPFRRTSSDVIHRHRRWRVTLRSHR